MAYIELVEKEDAPSEVFLLYEKGEENYGRVLETWKAIAHNPAIFQAYLPYVRAIFSPGALDDRIKDLVAIRIAYLLECRYSISHRVASARNQAIPEQDIVAVADPASHDFSDAEQAALAFAEELTTGADDVPYHDNRQVVSQETLEAVKQHFSDAEIAELAISVGLWNALARFHRVMDFDLDMPAPPPELDVVDGAWLDTSTGQTLPSD